MWTEYALNAQQFKSYTQLPEKGAKLHETIGLTLTTLSLLDSIDGRLLDAGYCLFWLPIAGRAGVLIVRDADSHVRNVELQLKSQPKTPDDLPPQLLGGALHEALSHRAFVALEQTPVALQCASLQAKGQIIADVTAVKAKGLKRQCLWVDGRRGFASEQTKAFDGLPKSTAKTSLVSVLIASARHKASLNSKGFPSLKPAQSTAQALQVLHETLLAQMSSQVGGTLSDVDIEFLHDLRVSSRRARSLLQTMRGYLTQEAQDYAMTTYKWIGQQTTDLRDLDVYLADFPALEMAVSKELAGALEPFKAALKQQRTKALRQVRTLLKSKRFNSFLQDWEARLKADNAFTKDARKTPIGTTATQAILKRYRRICRDGAAITADTPAEALHDLRKEGKKLRYLLEFFASLYPPELVKPRIASLKKLQDLLGAYQDCAVQAAFLESKAVGLRADSNVPAETLMAMGALADQRLQDEKRLRKDFDAFFGPFSSAQEQKHYKKMAASVKV